MYKQIETNAKIEIVYTPVNVSTENWNQIIVSNYTFMVAFSELIIYRYQIFHFKKTNKP